MKRVIHSGSGTSRQRLSTMSAQMTSYFAISWKVFNHGFLELHCLSFLRNITQRLGVCFSGSFTDRPNLHYKLTMLRVQRQACSFCSAPPSPHSRHASTLTRSLGRWAAARVCFPPRCCKPGIKGIPRDVKLPACRHS